VLFAGGLLPHADTPIVTCGHNDDSDVFAIGGDPIAPGRFPMDVHGLRPPFNGANILCGAISN
jgi:hypothetical protein